MFSVFTTMMPNHRLTIVSPPFRQKPQLLAQFLDLPAMGYLCFEGAHLTAAAMLRQLSSISADGDALHDLSYLILDECDRAIPAELDRLLHQLLREHPHTHLVIFSRRLPEIVSDKTIRALLHIIPADAADMLLSGNIEVEVQAFGSGRVTVNGREMSDWNGDKLKEIFFFMIANRQASRDAIAETFWQGEDTKAAMNVFQSVKRQLHKLFGFQLIEYVHGVYRLIPQIRLHYDVDHFLHLIDEGIAKQNEAMLTEAYQLCRYDFLQEFDSEWVKNRREAIRAQVAVAMLQLADIKAANGIADVALELYRQLRLLSPEREDIAQRLMSLYMERGEPEAAVQIYHEIADTLRCKYSIEPTSDLRQLGDAAQRQTLKSYIRRKRSS